MHSAWNFLIRYPVFEIYLKHLSVAPHLQSVYLLSHRRVPCPTLTPVTSYREHIAVENLRLCAQTDVPSHYFFVLPECSSSHSHSCSYILLTPCFFRYPTAKIFKLSHLLQLHTI